ncbi:hypothetical protein MyNCGM683_15510 [Achromobacter xylosoxidans]
MVNSIQFNQMPPTLRSLVASDGPTLQDLAEDAPEFQVVDQAALLANVQDDLAALLASVMRRQASRRNDQVEDSDNGGRDEVHDASRDEEVEKVRTLLRGEGAGWKASYDLARSLFPDPAELALLLAGLRDDAELDEEIRAEIEQALADLVAEHGQEKLTAGANIRRVVSSFARRADLNPDSLRQAYQSLLGGGSGESVTYRYLIDVFGFSRRGLALDFLEQALAADMAADAPSRSPDDFQPMLALLFQFRLLRSADALLTSAAGQHRRRGRRARKQDEIDLMDSALVELLLAALTDLHDARRQFEQFLRQWRKTAPEQQIAEWARGVLRAMADVPVELFPDLAYREALLVKLSDAVESLFYGGQTSGAHLGKRHV